MGAKIFTILYNESKHDILIFVGNAKKEMKTKTKVYKMNASSKVYIKKCCFK